jgi:hypothetical protein
LPLTRITGSVVSASAVPRISLILRRGTAKTRMSLASIAARQPSKSFLAKRCWRASLTSRNSVSRHWSRGSRAVRTSVWARSARS